jgi:hypothetical protein
MKIKLVYWSLMPMLLLFKGYICLLLSNGDKMLLLSCTILLWNLLGEKSMKKHFDICLSASNVAQIWGFYGTLCRAFLLHEYYFVRP